jgi:hypothetical protein
MAQQMGALVESSTVFELAHPVISNICCFYINPDIAKGGRIPDPSEIAASLQMQGKGVFSTITLEGKHCLRAAIVNHRISPTDVAAIVAAAEAAVVAKL